MNMNRNSIRDIRVGMEVGMEWPGGREVRVRVFIVRQRCRGMGTVTDMSMGMVGGRMMGGVGLNMASRVSMREVS